MVLQCCVETRKRTVCPRASIGSCFNGAITTRRGRFLPNKAKGRNALSMKELSVRPPSHTVLPSVVALIRPCSPACYLFRKSADYGRFFHASLYFPCYLHREAARQRPVALIAFRTGHGGGWDTFVRAARLVWSKRTRELAQLK